jgi:signal transduction histidine kinase
MFNSLKFKIITAAVIILSLIMTVATLRNIRSTEEKLLNGQKEKTVLLSDRISHGIMVLMLQNKWQDLQAMMESLIKDATELKDIKIFLPDNGVIVVSSNPDDIGKKIYPKDMEIFKTVGDSEVFFIEKNGEEYASKLTLIKNQTVCHRCHGPEKDVLGVLDVDISLAKVTKTMEGFKKVHLIEAIVGFFMIAGTFALVIGVLIARPVKKMIRTIGRIEAGDLAARMEEGQKDELGQMAKSFNSMLQTLESANSEIEACHVEQMQRAAKLASLGEIISGIAHEIKNPLTGISCAVQVFQSDMNDDDDKKAITSEILNHIKRLDITVKALLNYAKPKPPTFLPYNISDVLDKAVFFVYPEAKKNNVIIETDVKSDIPEAMMDPDQMQQVFLNLIINAVQAMPTGGKLKVSISSPDKESLEAESAIKEHIQSSRVLVVSFEDTGKGIEGDVMANVFDPFFTRKSKGTGLGLSISQRIVHEHGGEMIVESVVGKGSVFTIYLPVTSEGDSEKSDQ